MIFKNQITKVRQRQTPKRSERKKKLKNKSNAKLKKIKGTRNKSVGCTHSVKMLIDVVDKCTSCKINASFENYCVNSHVKRFTERQ